MSSSVSPLEARIYASAEALHDAVGPGFTMAQLEDAAGVSRATIYRRVGGKEAMLRHLAGVRDIDVVPAQDTRLRILEATGRVFGARGPAAATIEQIAADAGVGPATVYRHFGDKDGLARAFLHEMTPRTFIREAWAHPTADVAGDLRRIVAAMMAGFSEHRDLLRWVLLGGEDEQRYLDRLREPADSTFSRLAGWFRTQIDAGRLQPVAAPEDIALALLGMVVAATIVGPLHYRWPPPDGDEGTRAVVDLLLHDLRAESADHLVMARDLGAADTAQEPR
jgi:AcrR family transcriptional regulator